MSFIIVAENENKGVKVCPQSGKPGEEFACSDSNWYALWGFLARSSID